jgi:hypothetical protein
MKKRAAACLLVAVLFASTCFSEELPVPSSKNSVVVSFEHSPTDAVEVDYIKKNFHFGLYAWPSFSITTITLVWPWHASPSDSEAALGEFKNRVDVLAAAAKSKNVCLHLVLTSGLARGLFAYKDAKEEDIRNAQWYNDNKLASDEQIKEPAAMETFIFGTFSRYARKMRANLEAKAKAALAYLKRIMDESPDTLVAVSGWGEAELNSRRLNNKERLQDFFCDFSPFAVLEFRDWVRRSGEYDDATGKYKGQGFRDGLRYKGPDGLRNFNADFGTDFKTWDLRYFNWSLADDFDTYPADTVNNDPHRIPLASYVHGKMVPQSGPNYVEGGFDPPRSMRPGVRFWELWNYFREILVANFVKDVARWASEAGIRPDHWFSHQIPADYLFGMNPDLPEKSPRYYSSASALWTADVSPYGSPGATIYDQKYPDFFARTTDRALAAMAALSPTWAILEYDAESYVPGFETPESSPEFILDQYLRAYSYGPYLINFWRWMGEDEHRIKGGNKEIAIREFIQRIRDKGRSKDLSVVFTPPEVLGSRVEPSATGQDVLVRIGPKIWEGRPWEWKDWGDFARFEIFRGTEPGFQGDEAHLLARTSDYLFTDAGVPAEKIFFYRVRAVNSRGVAGPLSREIRIAK